MPAAKLLVPPTIDGVVDPQEWASASKSSNFVHVATGAKTAFEATVSVGYDEKNIYFAFDCPDAQPNLIRAVEHRRGADLEGDDHVIILLNPFSTFQSNDKNEFMIGAGGGLTAEFAGGRAAKREWEGAWEGKARLTDRGWECEVVVPWKILRLPTPGKRDIEVNFARVVPRAQTAIAWCEIGPQEQLRNNGNIVGIEVPKIVEPKEILALPYQIIGYDDERKEEVFNTGIDMRYSVTPQISSLLTINPDFRNVEGSILNLAFSRFERLAEERRPFFVEGQSEFRMGGMSASLFAPQRLGAFDLGWKAFGKLSDRKSFGTMVTTEFEQHTAAIGRFRQTWGEKSYLNTGFVHWDDRDNGIRNTAYALEVIEWRGNWGADIIYNGTSDNLLGSGKRFDVDLLYQDDTTFGAIGYQEISERFVPRIGFAPRKGFQGYYASINNNREFEGGPIVRQEWGLNYVDNEKEDGDGIYLRALEAWAEVATRSKFDMEANYERSNFEGERAELFGIGISYPENDPYRNVGISVTTGRVDDEDYRAFSATANYRLSNRISFSPSVQMERLGEERQKLYVLGFSYEIDKNRSVGGRAVVRDDKTNWYLAYRLSGNIGTEYFVILGDPNSETFHKRLILKAVFPMTIRF